jgi:hypothetical protein
MNRSTLTTRRLPWTLGCWLQGILIGCVFWSAPIPTPDALASPPVDVPGQLLFQDGKLAARVAMVPLRQVMEEIGRLSGAQVRWMDAEVGEQMVSIEFTALPLSEAVRRILSARNYLLWYAPHNEGTQLTQIWIASRRDGGGQPTLNRQPAPPLPPPPTAEEPVGAVDPPLEALMQTATGDADLASRLSAIEELGSATPQDARVRQILADLADHDSNPQVRDAASTMLGGRP